VRIVACVRMGQEGGEREGGERGGEEGREGRREYICADTTHVRADRFLPLRTVKTVCE
jgi:hypothetical protein